MYDIEKCITSHHITSHHIFMIFKWWNIHLIDLHLPSGGMSRLFKYVLYLKKADGSCFVV